MMDVVFVCSVGPSGRALTACTFGGAVLVRVIADVHGASELVRLTSMACG
jgi:hypothetical protein